MAFELYAHRDGLQFVQWIDRAAASAWLRRVGELRRAGPGAANEHAQRVLALAVAVLSVARLCDLPAPIFFPFVRAFRDRGAIPVSAPSTWRRAFLPVASAASTDARDWLSSGKPLDVSFAHRLWPRADSVLSGDQVARTTAPDPPAGWDTRFSYPDTWERWDWVEWFPSWASAADVGQASVVPPLALYWEAWAEAADRLERDGLDGTMVRSRIYAAAANLATAERLGLRLPEEIVRAAAEAADVRNGTDAEIIAWGSSVGGAVGSAAIVAGGASAVVPALLGLWLGVPFLLQAIFGRAAGRTLDWFGRTEPVYESTAISGSFDPRTAPSQVVEPPPAAPWRVPYTGALYLPERPNVEVLPLTRRSKGRTGLLLAAGALGLLALGSRR